MSNGIVTSFLLAILASRACVWGELANLVDPAVPNKIAVDCHVVILGAGISGAFSAYKLAPSYGDRVCLVEKMGRIGGRIEDASEKPGGPVFGLGPLRYPIDQHNMVQLAHELGIQATLIGSENLLFKVRGQNFLSNGSTSPNGPTQMCKAVFPSLSCSKWSPKFTDRAMWTHLFDLYRKNPKIADKHLDFGTFLRSVFGDEGYWFLMESCPLSSYLAPGYSVESVMEHMMRCETPEVGSFIGPKYYPIGGMSQFPKRLFEKAKKNGARLFLNQEVLSLKHSDGRFVIETKDKVFTADKVISSIVPADFKSVQGNVAEAVKASKEFRAVKSSPAISVSTYWDERFWDKSTVTKGLSLNRVVSYESCFSKMETQNPPYIQKQNVTRSVYDDGYCVDTWRAAIQNGKMELLKEEIVRELQRVFTDVKVPMPRKVIASVHEAAWHGIAALTGITSAGLRKWAARPLANRDFAMIGEAYSPAYKSWCEGALRSASQALALQYGFNFPCAESTESSADCVFKGEH